MTTQTPTPDAAISAQRERQVRAAVDVWSGQLMDLTGNNRLLFYRDLRVGTLDLTKADGIAVDGLLAGRTTLLSRLFPEVSDTDKLKRARAIRNKSREGLEERGIATCFLAIGMATWTNTKTSATPAAPVLLREASIAAVGAAEDEFSVALTGETDVNPSLIRLLSEQFAVHLDGSEITARLEDASTDPGPMFDYLSKAAEAVTGFSIAPRVVLGTFSYAKLPMVNDLESNAEALVAHEVIAAIAGHQPSQNALAGAGSPVEISDPDRRPPEDEYLVLDADSSQSYAINAAVAGQSIVVSGPPGTGKSQTISNLIATLVARGQSVLFVAEKRAAIAAVLDRLDRVGLADLVFDLHDGGGSKKAIAANLANALRTASAIARPDTSELHSRLVARRDRLNMHDSAMHRTRAPWGVSVFEAQCRLLELEGRFGAAVNSDFRLRGAQLVEIDGQCGRLLREQLEEFAALGGLSLSRRDSPWVGATVMSAEEAEAALDTAIRVRDRAARTRASLRGMLDELGLARPDSVSQWKSVLNLLDAVAANAAVIDPRVYEGPLAEMVSAAGTKTWRRDHPEWPGSGSGWWARRRLKKEARSYLVGDAKSTDVHRALWDAHEVAIVWSRHAPRGGHPRVPASLSDQSADFGQLERELAALGAYLSGTDLMDMSEVSFDETVGALSRDENVLRKIPRLNELRHVFERLGVVPLVDEMRARKLTPQMAAAMFDHVWLRSILERFGFEDPAIANFDGIHHSELAQSFRAADSEHVTTTRARVRRAAAENLYLARDAYPEQSRLVESQAALKRKHLPLRQLFAAAPDVMTGIKPCWAMSPLLVSQLLPGDRPYFDVVVFDEASQIVPADAVPAILRAKRVVVAGDRHQLPPTSFFSAASDGDDDVAQAVLDDGTINTALTDGYESILDVLSAALGERRTRSLTWHYRSRDERLISFSNAWMYDKSLTTFPGVAGHNCLRHEQVEGHLGTVDNTDSVGAEVERVVQLILEHADRRPDESLGVITMGIKHAERIDVALRERLRTEPQLHAFFEESATEKFFVKNLERVQGDERDAIILSIGYGKNADGRLFYRFGPLLQEGGPRRLNVAVTRARNRMTLVSSFSHQDMDPARSSAEGVKMLRSYLQYASSGGESLGEVLLEKPKLNPFEISVRDKLLAAGVPVIPQFGVAGYWIDFAAQHPMRPGQMVLAIEADGVTYHSSPTARDRDRLRQEQLERLGWTFHRIWSSDWFADPDTCVAKVRVAYDKAVRRADAEERIAPPATAPRNPFEPDSSEATMTPAGRGHRPDIPPGWPITEYSDRELADLLRWIESDTLLRTEDELLQVFMTELGFQRRGSRITAAFERALRAARR